MLKRLIFFIFIIFLLLAIVGHFSWHSMGSEDKDLLKAKAVRVIETGDVGQLGDTLKEKILNSGDAYINNFLNNIKTTLIGWLQN